MENRKIEETPAAAPVEGKGDVPPALPVVESPSISPAEPEPKSEPVASAPIAVEPVALAPAVESVADIKPPEPAADIKTPEPVVDANEIKPAPARFVLRPRHKRYALLAASVTLAAAFGTVFGALVTGGSTPPPRPDIAGLEERKAMQQSISQLTKEITTLKSNMVAANKAAQTQIAKISDKLNREAAEITGSISAPQTVTPQAATPIPTPRPAQRAAAVEPARMPVVQGWTVRDSRDGYVYVENHGEVYQVTPGAPLPGLGPVEQIKRQDGRWVVVTPKGLIVSLRDRRYFE